jgi:regulator of PEP synthase PpsR (kinase-PPPase family)
MDANEEEGPMNEERRESPPPIVIVTGGVGTSGEQVVNTVLAQYPDVDVPVEIVPHVREVADLERAIAMALDVGGTIVHTLVDGELRAAMVAMAEAHGVVAFDLMGPLMDRLTVVTGEAPLGRPGFYRQLHQNYFERVAAIEYALAHDDGRNRQDWPEADVVLIGVSRSGKTPLSIYLSILGWKAANMPIVPEIPIPPALYRLPRKRVIGLLIDIDRLLTIRRQRSRRMGMGGDSNYTHPGKVTEELQLAREVYRRGRFHVIDVTHKPIEAIADEVAKWVGEPK